MTVTDYYFEVIDILHCMVVSREYSYLFDVLCC